MKNIFFLAHTCLIALVSIHHCSGLWIRLISGITIDKFISKTLFVRWTILVTFAWKIFPFLRLPYWALFLQFITWYSILLQMKHLSLNFLTMPFPFTTSSFFWFLLWLFTIFSTIYYLKAIKKFLAFILNLKNMFFFLFSKKYKNICFVFNSFY